MDVTSRLSPKDLEDNVIQRYSVTTVKSSDGSESTKLRTMGDNFSDVVKLCEVCDLRS